MNKPTHILVGENLLLKVDHIVSANLKTTSDNNRECIKITLESGTIWTIYANLHHSREVLKSIPLFNDNLMLITKIESIVLKKRPGPKSKLSTELKELLNI